MYDIRLLRNVLKPVEMLKCSTIYPIIHLALILAISSNLINHSHSVNGTFLKNGIIKGVIIIEITRTS